MGKKAFTVGKNVTLELDNIDRIRRYQFVTHKNFSQTLNIMLNEWEKYRRVLEELTIKAETEKQKQAVLIDENKN